jgi:sec-independent protein translocase protein TatA
MLGLDNPIHIAFVLVLLLLVFGAKRLPEMGRSMGHGLRGFKDAITGEDTATEHLSAGPAPVRVDETHENTAETVAERVPMRPAA